MSALPSEGPYEQLRALVQGMTPEQLTDFAASLGPDDMALLEQVVADLSAEHWRADPARMGHHLDPQHIELYPYVQLLGRKWVQLEDGSDPYQVWLLPAQYGKSTLAQWGLAWSLDRYPGHRYITTSYGDELADRNGLAVRDILDAHAHVLRAQLRRDQRRRDRFLTSQGGGLLAAGLFAGMTGWGAHGIVIDDPFKGWEQAHSASHRAKVWNTYRSVVFLRRTVGKAWVLIVMTRWHELDLVGQLVTEAEAGTGQRFTVTRLPEVAELPMPDAPDPMLRLADPLGREPGQVLEPRKFDEAAVSQKRLVLGSYLWAGMAQQRPAPEEGTEILRAWFRVEPLVATGPDDGLTSWDMKLKDKEAGDYVVGQCWWRVGGGYWCVEQVRGRWNEATTANAIALLAVRHPEVKRHVVENSGNAPEVMALLRKPLKGYVVDDHMAGLLQMNDVERAAVQALRRRGMSGLVPNPPRGEKTVRMRAVTPLLEAGDVHLPEGAAWVPLYLDEMAAFPSGAHDDQVDATSQALSKLSKGAVRVGTAPAGTRLPTQPTAVPGGGNRTGPRGVIAIPGQRRR